jgi:hypothetical protein
MFYSENMTHKAEKSALTEIRVKVTLKQKEKLKDLEERLKIPASVLIRMALDSFIPKTDNCGFTERGIKAGYLNRHYV